VTVETDLIDAYWARLNGEDGHATPLKHNGNVVPAFTGNADADASAPYVVIGRPRTRGEEALDGTEIPEVRIQLRVHTAFPDGKGNHFKAYEIARTGHGLLEAAPITVDGHEPYVPEPDLDPIPEYDKGDEEALDLSVDYRFASL